MRMVSRYDPLTRVLRQAAARGQDSVEMSFEQIAELVGGLPVSSDRRQWWANSSQVQALAWRAADFHVEQVYLDRGRVRFRRGKVGGTYAGRGRVAGTGPSSRPSGRPFALAERAPVGVPVDVRIELQWLDGGPVILDRDGKPTFGALEEAPGLYRMTLTGGLAGPRTRVYIGESDSLRRRLSGNYRSPGSGQQTSLRINALLREHLGAGGTVSLAVATAATVWLNGVERPLDLTRKAGRLLAENAALVLAQACADVEIANLG
jgi:hypothetical protein